VSARRTLLLCGYLALGLGSSPPPAVAGQAALTIATGSAATLAMIAALPVVQVSVSFATAKGQFEARFAGPLLWSVLAKDGAVDPAQPRRQAGQTILVTGQDGYSAALAMGEVSPDFEGKSVILAESMNGHPLGPGHLRLVIPGDRKGARNVRDVARITVSAPQ
jgi:DMSO/TMAO reductase YedYZ molybdopterin-dependent catalytic subunit